MSALTRGLLALGKAVAAPASGVVGDWNGAISAGGNLLRVVVDGKPEKFGLDEIGWLSGYQDLD